jgi:hypothetical protein
MWGRNWKKMHIIFFIYIFLFRGKKRGGSALHIFSIFYTHHPIPNKHMMTINWNSVVKCLIARNHGWFCSWIFINQIASFMTSANKRWTIFGRGWWKLVSIFLNYYLTKYQRNLDLIQKLDQPTNQWVIYIEKMSECPIIV